MEGYEFNGNILDANPVECYKPLFEEIYTAVEKNLQEKLIRIRKRGGKENGIIDGKVESE